jgi:hypothetical protein
MIWYNYIFDYREYKCIELEFGIWVIIKRCIVCAAGTVESGLLSRVESWLLSQVKSCGVVAFELGTWWKASVSESVSPVLKTWVAESLSPAECYRQRPYCQLFCHNQLRVIADVRVKRRRESPVEVWRTEGILTLRAEARNDQRVCGCIFVFSFLYIL